MPSPERRRERREPIQVECKILRPWADRYVEAVTVDVSKGGALVLVEAGSPLRVGEEVEVLIAWDGQPLIVAEWTLRGTVVRAAGADLRLQPVAVRFERMDEVDRDLAWAA
ncbi:MAG: PilZ domain-containing protein [Phycisphaerales bacterium]